jgi:predicted metalloprotease with PDZ domain
MRWLWNNVYKKGKGFTITDVVSALNFVSGKNYGAFIDRYVAGTAIPPYDSIFAGAGYRLEFARGGQPVRLGSGGDVTARFVELPSTSAEQRKVRAGWLRKGD